MNNYLTIKEAAKVLKVSVQTLRNWDESGYFKAERTEGGHRRYLQSDISNFRYGDIKREAISCWEIDHANHLSELALSEGEKHPDAKPIGGFSKAEIGILFKNQETVHDEHTKNIAKKELMYELAASFASPYLFDVRVVTHPISLVSRKMVNLNNKIVYETQEVCSCTHSYELEWSYEPNSKEVWAKLIYQIDDYCLRDVLDSVGTISRSNYEDLDSKINVMIDCIDEKTMGKEPKIVIFPPELYKNNRLEKLTDNLKTVPDDFSNKPYKIFVSRLLPDNKVIVGTKSKDKFSGYVFCPYLLMCYNFKENKIMMRTGKRLLRGGENHYGIIEVN